jgi:UDP-N-acetylmuramoylalanine--D-glutamate ligase
MERNASGRALLDHHHDVGSGGPFHLEVAVMEFLNGKRVLILGLGESGLACARFAQTYAAGVRVADTRDNPQAPPPQLARLHDIAPAAEVRLGAFKEDLLEGVDRIVISPGLAPGSQDVRLLLEQAQEKAIPVESEIEWFAQALEHLAQTHGYRPKVVAITGTNGKTTVTMLATHLAQSAGVSTIACGNVSPAALDALMDALENPELPQLWVLELSSFQLQSTHSLQAHAAVVLNLTQDHLDWHGTMQDYAAAKARIFGAATVRVLNRDDPLVMRMKPAEKTAIPVVTFGTQAPALAGDWGIAEDGALKWLVNARPVDDEPRKKNAPPTEVQLQRLMPADALLIRGSHNHANALAALALLTAVQVPLPAMLRGLRDYVGEPHRAQLVAVINDVSYVDDSKGTNVGACLAAVRGLAEGRRRILLIAGGQGKGQDFAPLSEIAHFIKSAALIGADAAQIDHALSQAVPTTRCVSLEDAVTFCAGQAQSGDVVLLSPACASLDMFKNYSHRAEVFAQAVAQLQVEVGQA